MFGSQTFPLRQPVAHSNNIFGPSQTFPVHNAGGDGYPVHNTVAGHATTPFGQPVSFGQRAPSIQQPLPFGQQISFGQPPLPFGQQPLPFGQQISFGQQPLPFGQSAPNIEQPLPFGQQISFGQLAPSIQQPLPFAPILSTDANVSTLYDVGNQRRHHYDHMSEYLLQNDLRLSIDYCKKLQRE